MKPSSRLLLLFALLALAVAACGGEDAEPDADSATTQPETDSAPDTTAAEPADEADSADEAIEEAEEMAEDAEEMAEGMVENLEEVQAEQGGGSATLSVGDETWEFDSVLCAFGEEEIGQEGAEVVVSSIQDDLQFYVSIDSFGHSVSLDDVGDFQNPSVSLSADSIMASLTGAPEEFIQVDGKSVSGETTFVDNVSDDMAQVEGTFEATCP